MRPHLSAMCPHLGATRPRVCICLSRLDALTGKYNIHFLIAKLGHRAPVGNADAGTRRPQVRTRRSPPSEDVQLFDSLKKDKGKQYSRACVSFCFPVLSC